MKIVGVDVGRKQDHTVCAVLVGGTVRLIERLPLALTYAEMAEHIIETYVPLADRIVVDASGLGDPFHEMLMTCGRNIFTAFVITSGETVAKGSDVWRVPRNTLIETLHQSMARKALKVACPEPGRSELMGELRDIKRSNTRPPIYESGAHDDCVMAVALANFYRVMQ